MKSPRFTPSNFRENSPTPNSVKTTSFPFILMHYALTDRSFHTTWSQLRTVWLNKPQFKKYGRAGVFKLRNAGLCYAARGHIYRPYTHMKVYHKSYTTMYAVNYRTMWFLHVRQQARNNTFGSSWKERLDTPALGFVLLNLLNPLKKEQNSGFIIKVFHDYTWTLHMLYKRSRIPSITTSNKELTINLVAT
jgi:hypothetical protein